MYTAYRRLRHHYLRYAFMALVACMVIAGALLLRSVLQSKTQLNQSPPVTHQISASAKPSQHITKGIVALDLPSGWETTAPPNTPHTIYSWRGGTDSEDASRRVDLYLDTMPATLAVNRLLPVQANGDHLEVTGATSDNCVNFTDKTPESVQTGRSPSKWGGVNFWCDVANYERDVVAIGSTEGVNTVTLTGPTNGSHKILLVYTDNSASPDYSVFLAIVRSVTLM